ncbi:hypothetical protein [Streptomyces sp. NPDC055140]
MNSEVFTAVVGAPAVLITAAAAWAAGRSQSHGTYRGSVDAVRRASQREAYAELYRAARRFIIVFDAVDFAGDRTMAGEITPALDALEHAADMVSLEGPENLATLAERIFDNARRLGGQRLPSGARIRVINTDTPEGMRMRNEAVSALSSDLPALLKEARRYLNGGPSR